MGRDLLAQTLRALGAEVVEIGRSAQFIPIDTEGVGPDHRALLREAAVVGGLSAAVSTDGDRPLVVDEAGQIVAGDVLGQITAIFLGAEVVVTPVSSNTGVQAMGFPREIRTRIDSPHVIAGIEAAGQGRVVGYEANGGFLLGFDATGPGGSLPRLMTRDSLLPIVVPLIAAGEAGLGALVRGGPQRFTAADRLVGVATNTSAALIDRMRDNPHARAAILCAFGSEQALDLTDRLRVNFTSGRIVHLRPSGNVPEMRVYAEAESAAGAQALLETARETIRAALMTGDRA